MRMIWARRKVSPQGAVDRIHFVVLDFLKLFTAAVVCGVAVSVTVAGIALLLAGDANALTQAIVTKDDSPATPGTLLATRACDGYAMKATERDWYVRIDGNVIHVRVMQTWIMPADFEGAAAFAVTLPTGANLRTLSAQTANREIAARVIPQREYERMRPADYLKYTREQLFAIKTQGGSVRTSPIPGLAADDTMVIQYTYTVNAVATGNGAGTARSLTFPLQENDNAGDAAEAITAGPDDALRPTRRPATPGTVWVEWAVQKPVALIATPRAAEIDHGVTGIDGLNWYTPAIQPGEKFNLRWKA